MAVAPGTLLGPYEIVSAIGAGGMGEVYRARDPRLGRDVAIKVLHGAVAETPERLQRFEQEARAAAALNHPNILAVYDIGRHPSPGSGQAVPFIVSELLEGATLRATLDGGPLPIRKAIDCAVQVAQGLAAAHDRGIVHRDLKPENLFVTRDGHVKVLDFGLAKLTQADASAPAGTMAPTMAPQTAAGMVLGTVGYMAPEQVRGQEADHRADIFALGTILYEMVAGQRAFRGDTPADMMTAVLKDAPPDLSSTQRHVPPALARIVERCIEKNPAARFQSTRDLAFALTALSSADSTSGAPAVALRAGVLSNPRVAWASVAALLVALLAIGGAATAGIFSARPSPEPPVRFQIPSPNVTPPQMMTLSRDGRYVAFVSGTDASLGTAGAGGGSLWVRALDSLEARELPGTEGATYPFWSPDSTEIAFFSEGKLRKIRIAGGPPQALCDVAEARGGTWNDDGLILFSAGPTSPLLRVSASGGTPAAVTAIPAEGQQGHRFPSFLPDGRHFLYLTSDFDPNQTGIYLGSLDGAEPRRLLPDDSNAIYVPPLAPATLGYLLYRSGQTLTALPFDSERLTVAGGPVAIVEQVPLSGNLGFGAFSASWSGRLVYRTGGPDFNRELVWIDRQGTRGSTEGSGQAFFFGPAISPDASSVAYRVDESVLSHIWVRDVERDVVSRLSFGSEGNYRDPVWSPDGRRIAFSLQRSFDTDIRVKSAEGSGQEELLLQSGVNGFVLDWSRDGKWLAYQYQGRDTGTDIRLLPLEGDRTPVLYLATRAAETLATFAPAAGTPEWMAYVSDETGRTEVYIQSIPPGRGKFQVSTGGGIRPQWRADGRELYYLAGARLMAVAVSLGASAQVGSPRVLFEAQGATGFDVTGDGQRFLVNVPLQTEARNPPMIVVTNWTTMLDR